MEGYLAATGESLETSAISNEPPPSTFFNPPPPSTVSNQPPQSTSIIPQPTCMHAFCTTTGPGTEEIDPWTPPNNLLSPSLVMQKYPNLLFVGTIGTLVVKLAREAYFGSELMAMCTVHGCKGFAFFPKEGINHRKRLLMQYFAVSNEVFAALWKS